MTKIFATKALSMVLCFVMLFMGAPVTTWAFVTQEITGTKGGASVTLSTDQNNPVEVCVGESIELTAVGFTDLNTVSWTVTGASGAVTSTSGNGETFSLTYSTAVESETLIAVKATYDSEEATVYFQLVVPTVNSIEIVKAANELADENISGGRLVIRRTEPGSYTFAAAVKDQQDCEMVGESVTWSVADDATTPCGATIDEASGEFAFTKVGKAKITATSTTNHDKLTSVDVIVESAIHHVSIVQPTSTTVNPGDSVTLSARAYTGATGEDEIYPPFAWSITDGSSYASVDDNGTVTFKSDSAGQTVTVKVASTFDPSTSDEVTFEVAAADPVVYSVKIYADAEKTNEISELEMQIGSEPVTLYAKAFAGTTPDEDATITWELTDGADVVSLDGSVITLLPDAAEGDTATITAKVSDDVMASITVTVKAEASVVNYVDVWLSDDEGEATVSSLTMFVGDTVHLTACVDTDDGNDKGVQWESSKSSVVSVGAAAGYHATLTATAVGSATITVTSVDDEDVTHEIAVTVIEPTTISFTPRAAVYNTDLWTINDTSSYARFLKIIGFIKDDESINSSIEHVKVTDSSGTVVAQTGEGVGIGDFLCRDWWVEENIDSLREDGYVSDDALPIVFDYHWMLEAFSMDDLTPGTYTVELITFDGVTHTSSITIAHNEVYENAKWTKGSSENLLIAKMPNITNDLLATKISDLKISKDGTQLLKNKGNTDILEADAETGNVYIKKAILDTLEAGTYSIAFKAGDRAESFNFVVVDHRDTWGAPMTRLVDRKVQYVDAAGKTSIELTSENLANGILWLLEDSDGASAWYGIDLSDKAFELNTGSRFYVQWLHEGDAEYDTYYAQLDDEQKANIENGWIFLIGVEDASGNKVQPASPVKTYVQIGDDWDLDELKAYYIAAGEDQSIDVEDILGFAYPEGEDEFGMMMLSHFSPYLIMDELSDAEKIALGKGKNNKTGDQAVQIAVAGLGSILVLALGIMLRLLTSKKKFEE